VRKFLILAVLVGGMVFAAISFASTNSGSASQESAAATAQDKARATVAGQRQRFGLRYLFAEVNLGPNETGGRVFRCPRRWHPLSGLFVPDSNEVVSAADGPVSQRKWLVRVRHDGGGQAKVTIGAVCAKGLNLR
jgi:hypothetical protein